MTTLTAAQTAEIVQKFGKNGADCGLPEVQIALLSQRISDLTGHFKSHKKDVHSRHGLTKLVSQRRRLLKYLKSTATSRYQSVIEKLGLRDIR